MRKAVLRASMLGAWLWAVAPGPVAAQHGTTGWGSMPMDPRTSAMLEVQTAEFDLPGRAGVWETWAARVEYAFVPWFSLAARPALAYVDDDEGPSEIGLSDLEVVPKARVWKKAAGWPASVSVGLSAELPAGDADTGTGNGHVSLMPFATFSSVPVRGFMLHAMVGDRFVVSGEHEAGEHDAHAQHAGHEHGGAAAAPAAPHGSVIMPHGEHELMLHAGACFMLPLVVISPGIEWMQTFEPEAETQLSVQLEVALVPRKELRFAVGVDVPLASEPRYGWRARMMTAWLF